MPYCSCACHERNFDSTLARCGACGWGQSRDVNHDATKLEEL